MAHVSISSLKLVMKFIDKIYLNLLLDKITIFVMLSIFFPFQFTQTINEYNRLCKYLTN